MCTHKYATHAELCAHTNTQQNTAYLHIHTLTCTHMHKCRCVHIYIYICLTTRTYTICIYDTPASACTKMNAHKYATTRRVLIHTRQQPRVCTRETQSCKYLHLPHTHTNAYALAHITHTHTHARHTCSRTHTTWTRAHINIHVHTYAYTIYTYENTCAYWCACVSCRGPRGTSQRGPGKISQKSAQIQMYYIELTSEHFYQVEVVV